MANIKNLTISYPDFVLGTVISPVEFDQNNLDIQTKVNEVIGVVNTDVTALVTHKASGDHDDRYYTEAEADAKFALSQQIMDIVNNSVPVGTITDAMLSDLAGAIKERTATHIASTLLHRQAFGTTQTGTYANAEGNGCQATGNYSHAEGDVTYAQGSCSHAEGFWTEACEFGSHAEGDRTNALGLASHSEGDRTRALGLASHSEGFTSIANGDYSHVQGSHTIADGKNQTVIGAYNVAQGTVNSIVDTDHAFIIGNGTGNLTRSNAFSVTWGGDVSAAGNIYSNADSLVQSCSAEDIATAGNVELVVTGASSLFRVEPTGDITFTITGGVAGQRITIMVTTIGATNRNLYFSTNFKSKGYLATSISIGKLFTIEFICKDGTTWVETSRSLSM